jgi:hypothetical protein
MVDEMVAIGVSKKRTRNCLPGGGPSAAIVGISVDPRMRRNRTASRTTRNKWIWLEHTPLTHYLLETSESGLKDSMKEQ